MTGRRSAAAQPVRPWPRRTVAPADSPGGLGAGRAPDTVTDQAQVSGEPERTRGEVERARQTAQQLLAARPEPVRLRQGLRCGDVRGDLAVGDRELGAVLHRPDELAGLAVPRDVHPSEDPEVAHRPVGADDAEVDGAQGPGRRRGVELGDERRPVIRMGALEQQLERRRDAGGDVDEFVHVLRPGDRTGLRLPEPAAATGELDRAVQEDGPRPGEVRSWHKEGVPGRGSPQARVTGSCPVRLCGS